MSIKEDYLEWNKARVEQTGYDVNMNVKVNVQTTSTNVYEVYHDEDYLLRLDQSIEAGIDFGNYIYINDIKVSLNEAEEVSASLKELNTLLYNYLQDKYDELEAVDINLPDDEYLAALEAILWEYPINDTIIAKPIINNNKVNWGNVNGTLSNQSDLQSELDDRRHGKKVFNENVDLVVGKYLHIATLDSISAASLVGVINSDFYSPAFNLNIFHVYNDVKYELGLTHYTLANESQFDKLIFTQSANGNPINVYFRIAAVHDTLITANISIDGSYTKTKSADSGLILRGNLVDSVSNVKLEVDINSQDFRSTNVAPIDLSGKEDSLGLGTAGQVLATNATADGKEWIDLNNAMMTTQVRLNGDITGTQLVPRDQLATYPMGMIVPNDGRTYKIVGLVYSAGSATVGQVDTCVTRISAIDVSSDSQYTIGDGDTLHNSDVFTSTGPETAVYYKDSFDDLSTSPITLPNGKAIFFEINPSHWVIKDLTIDLMILVDSVII